MARGRVITSRVLTIILAVVFILSSIPKVFSVEGAVMAFSEFGLSEYILLIGLIEIIIGVLFLIPMTYVIATLLGTAYFGGAVVAHLVAGQPLYVLTPIILLIIIWANLMLKKPDLFKPRKVR